MTCLDKQWVERGGGSWIPTHSQPGARRWLEVNTTLWPLYTEKKNLVPIVQVAGWDMGLVWIAGKTLPPPEFDTHTSQTVASHDTGLLISPLPDQEGNKSMFLSKWHNFLWRLALQKKKNLMTARLSILLKSHASLTCFRASFLPGRAKDLSAPWYWLRYPTHHWNEH